jgi:chloramphenicol-sensitive protein RarD
LENNQAELKKGHLFAFCAFFFWGLFPLYWKQLHHVNVWEVIGHRIFWATFFLFIIHFKNGLRKELNIFNLPHSQRSKLVLSGILIFINWALFIWAVNRGFIIECSLGYFITPLMNVFLGVGFLKEKLKNYQWLSVSILVLAISYLFYHKASNAFIPLGLSLSFASYGLIRKKLNMPSTLALFYESSIMCVFALMYFGYLIYQNEFYYINGNLLDKFLLTGAGPVTLIPLILFGLSINRLPLSIIGIFQYITPTLQLLTGVFIYHEDFSIHSKITFVLIWIALLIFTTGGKLSRYFSKNN